MPHPFSPAKNPTKRKRQLRHVASYYNEKGDEGAAAKFSGGPSKEAISRRLKKKRKK